MPYANGISIVLLSLPKHLCFIVKMMSAVSQRCIHLDFRISSRRPNHFPNIWKLEKWWPISSLTPAWFTVDHGTVGFQNTSIEEGSPSSINAVVFIYTEDVGEGNHTHCMWNGRKAQCCSPGMKVAICIPTCFVFVQKYTSEMTEGIYRSNSMDSLSLFPHCRRISFEKSKIDVQRKCNPFKDFFCLSVFRD